MRLLAPFLLTGVLGLAACASRAPSGPYPGGYVGGAVAA